MQHLYQMYDFGLIIEVAMKFNGFGIFRPVFGVFGELSKNLWNFLFARIKTKTECPFFPEWRRGEKFKICQLVHLDLLLFMNITQFPA